MVFLVVRFSTTKAEMDIEWQRITEWILASIFINKENGGIEPGVLALTTFTVGKTHFFFTSILPMNWIIMVFLNPSNR